MKKLGFRFQVQGHLDGLAYGLTWKSPALFLCMSNAHAFQDSFSVKKYCDISSLFQAHVFADYIELLHLQLQRM